MLGSGNSADRQHEAALSSTGSSSSAAALDASFASWPSFWGQLQQQQHQQAALGTLLSVAVQSIKNSSKAAGEGWVRVWGPNCAPIGCTLQGYSFLAHVLQGVISMMMFRVRLLVLLAEQLLNLLLI
jgi:hypothetical protein